jgi:hypothetical protein
MEPGEVIPQGWKPTISEKDSGIDSNQVASCIKETPPELPGGLFWNFVT